MAIVLDTVYDAGELDTDYTHVKISDIRIFVKSQRALIIYELGTQPGADFVPGKVGSDSIDLSGADFAAAAASVTLNNETLYDAMKRVAYAKLQEKIPRYAGALTP